MKYAEPEPETIASCQARATSWKALADSLSIENQAQAARIRELGGALRGAIEHMETCGTALRIGALSRVSAAVYLCGGQGAIGAAEEARRILAEGGKP